jgi:hypothetical protein
MLSLLKKHPDIVHVETEDCESVPEVLTAFAGQDVDILVVNGGDGTLQRALTTILNRGVFERPPLIAPLRGGRTNMSASDLGCQRGPVKALESLIEAAHNRSLEERLVNRAVLRVEILPEELVEYGMFCGVGVIHRGVDLVHRTFPPGRHSRGVLGAGVLTGVLVGRGAMQSTTGMLAPDRMQIRLDGEAVAQDRFQLVMATTLEHLFLRIQPFWGREPAPVRVTAIAAGARRLWASAIGILRGRPPSHVTPEGGYTSRNVHRAEFRLDCGLMVDGELFPPQRNRIVRIEADHTLRFVRA